MAGTCGTPGLFRNLRHSLRQTATRVLGTTISTLRACGAGGRGQEGGGQGFRFNVKLVLDQLD